MNRTAQIMAAAGLLAVGAGCNTTNVSKSPDFHQWVKTVTVIIFPANFDAKFWAPSAAIHKDGRYYLFPTFNNRITAVVADSPEGPFRTLDGKDINKTSGWKHFPILIGHPIDAEIFRDH